MKYNNIVEESEILYFLFNKVSSWRHYTHCVYKASKLLKKIFVTFFKMAFYRRAAHCVHKAYAGRKLPCGNLNVLEKTYFNVL